MSDRDLNQYDVKCHHCGGSHFLPTVIKKFTMNGGLKTLTGPLCCLDCHQLVDLNISVQRIELERKRAEVERLQEEIEAVGGRSDADVSADAWGGDVAAVEQRK